MTKLNINIAIKKLIDFISKSNFAPYGVPVSRAGKILRFQHYIADAPI